MFTATDQMLGYRSYRKETSSPIAAVQEIMAVRPCPIRGFLAKVVERAGQYVNLNELASTAAGLAADEGGCVVQVGHETLVFAADWFGAEVVPGEEGCRVILTIHPENIGTTITNSHKLVREYVLDNGWKEQPGPY